MTLTDREAPSVLAAGPSLEAAAAAFGPVFDDLRVTTFADLAAELASDDFDVMAVAAGPGAVDALEAALEGRSVPEVLLEVPWDPREAEALDGLLRRRRIGVAPRPLLGFTTCLRVRTAPAEDDPGPADWVAALCAVAGAAHDARTASHDSLQVARLEGRVRELERSEDDLRQRLEAARDRAADARQAQRRAVAELEASRASRPVGSAARFGKLLDFSRNRRVPTAVAAAAAALAVVVLPPVGAAVSGTGVLGWAVLCVLLLTLGLLGLALVLLRGLRRRALPGPEVAQPDASDRGQVLLERLRLLELSAAEVAAAVRSNALPDGTVEPSPLARQLAQVVGSRDQGRARTADE